VASQPLHQCLVHNPAPMLRPRLVVAFLLLLVATALQVAAQEADETAEGLRRRVEALEREQRQMGRDLAEMKRLVAQALAASPAPGPDLGEARFDLADNPVKGDPHAPLTLIEFTDYECGFCARYFRETYPRILEEYVATGRIRYVALDLPLESLHPLSFQAARASHCAADQGKFWEMHDRLFGNRQFLGAWVSHAEAVGLDVAAFSACLDSDRHADAVRREMSEAGKAGATGTPSFVIGRTLPAEPSVVVGLVSLRGAQPYEAFRAALDQALAEVP
jgi:protein-disulfide isomerase